MILGVTGGIATGKSSVAELFRQAGCPVVSADELARQVVACGSQALQAIIDRFGAGVLTADGELDRERLAAIVFSDPEARQALNRITHPAIAELAVSTLSDLQAQGAPLVVYEAPLLYEAGAEGRVDRVLVVTAIPDVQRARLMARDGIDADAAQARIAAQLPLADKIRRADYVIDNSGSPEQTRRLVEALFRDLGVDVRRGGSQENG